MDLIYTDSTKKDIGVIKDYTMDLAYGSEENSFELTVPLSSDIIETDSIIYMDGTEYGGFVDERIVSTKSNTIKYKGRTTHGFLNSYVIYPNGQDGYRTVTGNAKDILTDLLLDFNILSFFEITDTDIFIPEYKFRYDYIYDGFSKMLATVSAKIVLTWHNDKIRVSISNIRNYSAEGELDSSQLLFTVGNKENCVNHLICMGQGELTQRKIWRSVPVPVKSEPRHVKVNGIFIPREIFKRNKALYVHTVFKVGIYIVFSLGFKSYGNRYLGFLFCYGTLGLPGKE